ncbi:MAG: hypothetical protein HY921_01550 [Elusimicrobia bacterium]|nr:hypothetical protein [Elusimicrobiota bacterium]
MTRAPRAKFILSACALLGFYLGGLAGAFASARAGVESPVLLLAWLSAFALGGLALAFLLGRSLLGESARHASLASVLIFLVPAAAGLFMVQRILEALLRWRLPAFIENLALWLAALAAIWADEPDL